MKIKTEVTHSLTLNEKEIRALINGKGFILPETANAYFASANGVHNGFVRLSWKDRE